MSNTEALPELPEPSGVIIVGTQALRAFTADQMRAYALQSLAQPAKPDADIDEAKIARLHERGAVAWAGVDAADLRAGGDGKPAASGEPAGLSLSQEPKYTVTAGAIVNRSSGEAIPPDEPVFIFRARDVHAREAIEAYACVIEPGEHRDAVVERVADFARFAAQHPERMRVPDTARAAPQPAPAPPASGEPVAYSIGRTLHWHEGKGITDAQLYASAQPAPALVPLHEDALYLMADECETPAWGEWYSDLDALLRFARAIESHHGIGTPAKEAP